MFIRVYLQDTDVSQEKPIHFEADLGFKYTSCFLLAMDYGLGEVKKPVLSLCNHGWRDIDQAVLCHH